MALRAREFSLAFEERALGPPYYFQVQISK